MVLATSQIASAIAQIENFHPTEPSVALAVAQSLVLSALKDSNSDFPSLFLPIDESSFFYREYATGLRTLSLFDGNVQFGFSDPVRQINLALTYIFAYCFERVSTAKAFTDFDSKVISYFEKYASDLDEDILTRVSIIKLAVAKALSTFQHTSALTEIETVSSSIKAELASQNTLIANWKSQLSADAERVDRLQQVLTKNKDELNFMGLTAGFSRLLNDKNKEKNNSRNSLFFIVAALVAIPIYGITHVNTLTFDGTTLIRAIPLAALELLVLYFFRIVLRNYYSSKAQILQIELRRSLLGMIEEYASFRQRVAQNSKDVALDKFESLIFSGISADLDNIPSQFDGLEQLINLAKEFKK